MKRTASSLVGGVSPPPLRRKVESTTTKTAVASFFTPASQKKPEKVTWRIVNKSLIVGKYASESKGTDKVHTGKRSRVAAFDFDSTLISTASGNRFARDASDWKWWNNKVPERLKQLNADGYQVIVVSNQKKISLQSEIKGGRTESKSLTTFKEKALVVMRQLDIPLSIYAATQYDEYRKPRTGMWKEFLDDYDLDVDSRLDLEESFFVGDAAGRQTDHSCVDRDFASNAGLKFKTPEEFFLDASPEQAIRQFDPTSYIGDDPDSAGKAGLLNLSTGVSHGFHDFTQRLQYHSVHHPSMESDDQLVTPTFSKLHPIELVIFCGSPGAGKSTFYWKYLKPLGYERVNQDILKSRQKCIKVAKEYLSAGQSVAIDNTNAGTETRAYWTEIAKEFKIPIRCVYFIAPPALCKHNDAVRAANPTLNPESRTALPGIAFGDFARRFQEPQLSEGFEDITRVQFRFDGDEDAKKVWSQFWV